jgi:hypothetical protein
MLFHIPVVPLHSLAKIRRQWNAVQDQHTRIRVVQTTVWLPVAKGVGSTP